LLSRGVASDSPTRSDALEELRGFPKWENDTLQPKVGLSLKTNAPDGSAVSEQTLIPKILIDPFLHGHYLHKGNAKSDQLDAFPLSDITRHVFLATMTELCWVYYTTANFVRQVLAMPDLVDAMG
jgi:hypothetical protein